ncbi:hypothetical protein LTR39_001673 [Cryomyces antarcticus]|nr:hypothetical protein LTR39_001673 [Cryomyces antarcticus]
MASSVISLFEIPTLTALYQLGKLSPCDTTETPNAIYNDKISLIRNDITKLEVDTIVNAANESLLGGGGVDGAIHRAAGPRLVQECEKLNGCPTGDAKITHAYNLPCKAVIHAVGPVYYTSKRQNMHTNLLQSCYRRSLQLAVKHGLKSIAFSALSTGIYGYPSEEAAVTALDEVRGFLEQGEGDSLERIVFCSFTEKDEKAYEKYVPEFFPPVERAVVCTTAKVIEPATVDVNKASFSENATSASERVPATPEPATDSGSHATSLPSPPTTDPTKRPRS